MNALIIELQLFLNLHTDILPNCIILRDETWQYWERCMQSVSFCVVLVTLRGWRHFAPHPQNRILVHTGGSFQHFCPTPRPSIMEVPFWSGGCEILHGVKYNFFFLVYLFILKLWKHKVWFLCCPQQWSLHMTSRQPNWTLFLCKHVLLFQQSGMAAGHVSENAPLENGEKCYPSNRRRL